MNSLYALVPAEIDTTAITAAITDLGTKGAAVVGVAVAAGFGIWGLVFLVRKARGALR